MAKQYMYEAMRSVQPIDMEFPCVDKELIERVMNYNRAARLALPDRKPTDDDTDFLEQLKQAFDRKKQQIGLDKRED